MKEFKTTTSVAMPIELYEQLDALSKATKVSKSKIVRTALEAFFNYLISDSEDVEELV